MKYIYDQLQARAEINRITEVIDFKVEEDNVKNVPEMVSITASSLVMEKNSKLLIEGKLRILGEITMKENSMIKLFDGSELTLHEL